VQADALVRPGPRLVAGAQWLVRCINQLERSWPASKDSQR